MARTKEAAPKRPAPKRPAKGKRTYTKKTKNGKRRKLPGEKALKEIRNIQGSTDLLLRKLPFQRLVRELCDQISSDLFKNENKQFRWQASALEALQEAAERYTVGLLNDSNLAAIHAKRVTLFRTDMVLVQRVRGEIRNDLNPGAVKPASANPVFE